MSTTLTPKAGVAAHPAVKAPQPVLQVQPAGPGLYTWRIFDAAASYITRTHTGYAAGHVGFPVDGTALEVSAAYDTACAEAAEALGEVRRILRTRH